MILSVVIKTDGRL
jgi:hypothetical protein